MLIGKAEDFAPSLESVARSIYDALGYERQWPWEQKQALVGAILARNAAISAARAAIEAMCGREHATDSIPRIDQPLDLKEACQALRCGRRWFLDWLHANPNYGYRIGRSYRFTRDDIIAIRDELKCLSSSSKAGTGRPITTSAGLSEDNALTKALALAAAQKRKRSGRSRKAGDTSPRRK